MADKAGQITQLLAPTVQALGLELLGAEYLPMPGSALLRLYIDRPADGSDNGGGPDAAVEAVTIEDCEAVSREVSAQLDVEDPISGAYTLEVSSPGLDRPLFTLAQFARFTGQTVKLGLKLPQEGRRRLQGVIAAVDSQAVSLQVDDQMFTVPADNIDKARLVPDWAALGLGGGREQRGRPARPRRRPAGAKK